MTFLLEQKAQWNKNATIRRGQLPLKTTDFAQPRLCLASVGDDDEVDEEEDEEEDKEDAERPKTHSQAEPGNEESAWFSRLSNQRHAHRKASGRATQPAP
ncbi:hypothetical protein [Planctellipticum variicoloris]|uniref:hypothetical protein n=1 Tax=Planctellipticum variicoloris TaxID=3064265 RepID=UPI00301324AC|nr:hypothetical protein SH412_002574 [Planctomycetaceae bacterium SH412]